MGGVMLKRFLGLAAAMVALSACSTLGSEYAAQPIQALGSATTAAETVARSEGIENARAYRQGTLIEIAASLEMRPGTRPTTQDEVTPFDNASALLCGAQERRLLGAAEVRNVAAFGRVVNSIVPPPPDTVIENAALLLHPPGVPSLGDDAAEAGTAGPTLVQVTQRCNADVTAASQLTPVSAVQQSSVSAGLDLVRAFVTNVRPQLIAVLQARVRAQQLETLRAFLADNRTHIDTMETSLRRLAPQLAAQQSYQRRLAAYRFLRAYDAFGQEMRRRPAARRDTMSVFTSEQAAYAVDPANTRLVAVLDAAAAYDASLSEETPWAFVLLADAINELQKVETSPDATASGYAASLASLVSFVTALNELADSAEDPELKAALERFIESIVGDDEEGAQ